MLPLAETRDSLHYPAPHAYAQQGSCWLQDKSCFHVPGLQLPWGGAKALRLCTALPIITGGRDWDQRLIIAHSVAL